MSSGLLHRPVSSYSAVYLPLCLPTAHKSLGVIIYQKEAHTLKLLIYTETVSDDLSQRPAWLHIIETMKNQ